MLVGIPRLLGLRMRALRNKPRSFWATVVVVLGGLVTAGAAITTWDQIKPWPSEQACDALLRTIQRDLFAAQHNRDIALDRVTRLTDPDAIAINRERLRSARESVQVFKDKKVREMKECNR